MQDFEYELLKIKAAVTPQKESWPSPDVEVSILGDRPTIKGGALYWAALHSAVSDARDRVTKAFAKMAAIDDDKTLSREGKDQKKKEIAEAAVASLGKSKTLAAARDSGERQVAKWNEQLGLTPKTPETVGDAMMHAEIRSHLAAMKPVERLAFCDAHASEIAAAVLSAPSFLSGLTPAELGVVKQRIEARADPEVAAAKAAAVTALAETERGCRNAANQIRARGGLEKPHDGVAQRAGASMSDV